MSVREVLYGVEGLAQSQEERPNWIFPCVGPPPKPVFRIFAG